MGGTKPEQLEPLRRFFQHASVRYVGVRDQASADYIRQRLEPRVPVITTPDLVCALELPEVVRPTDPPIFGVAVRRRQDADDLSAVRKLAVRAQELGYRVRRIVLATGRTKERDLEATAALGLPDTELIASDDLMTITRAIGECTAMASMKFHGFVVATMYGVPSFVLMPTAKNRYLVETLGRPDLMSHYGDHELADRLTRDPAADRPGDARSAAGGRSGLAGGAARTHGLDDVPGRDERSSVTARGRRPLSRPSASPAPARRT